MSFQVVQGTPPKPKPPYWQMYYRIENKAIERLNGGDARAMRSIADLAERRETCRLLHEAIDRLTAIQRRRVIAYYFRGLNLREIAEIEGTSHATVAKCIKGALKKLRRFQY